MEWLALVAKALFILALLYIPYCLIAFIGGVKRLSLYAFSPLFTLAGLGILSLISPLTGWGVPSIAIAFIVLVLAAIAARLRKRASLGHSVSFSDQLSTLRGAFRRVSQSFVWALCGIFANTFIFFCIVATAAGVPDVLVQVYDNPFHLSVIRHIIETGNASPIGAGSVAGAPTSIYPDLWHALVAFAALIFGNSLQVNIWAIVSCLVAFVSPIGMCLLVHYLFPAITNPEKYLFASLGCMVIPRSFFTFITFGSLYTNLAGLALLPFAIAICIRALDLCRKVTRGALHVLVSICVSVVALGLLHPNIAILFMLFLIPMLIVRAKNLWVKVGIAIGSIAIWGLMFTSPLFSRTVNCLDRIAYSSEIGSGIFAKIHLAYSSIREISLFPLCMTIVILLLGFFIGWVLRKKWTGSWYALSIALLAAIFACSLFPENWFGIIGSGFWYRDAVRLMTFLIVMAIPLLAIIPSIISNKISHRIQEKPVAPKHGKEGSPSSSGSAVAAIGVTLACVVLCIPLGILATRSYSANLAKCTTEIEYATDPFALTVGGRSFAEAIKPIVGDSVLLNSDIDQSTWLYPEFGLNALIKAHPANYMASMDENIALLLDSIDEYGADSETSNDVQEAVAKLKVDYVVQMSQLGATTILYDNASVLYEDHMAIARIDKDTPGFELMHEDNGMRLFRIVEV